MRKTPGDCTSRMPRVLLVLWLAFLLAAAQSIGVSTSAYAAVSIAVGGRAVVVNTDGDQIRVRKGAGTQYDQVTSVYEGQVVTILAGPSTDAQNNKWFKIQAHSGTGWVAAEFLEGTTAPANAPTRKLTGFARVANTDGDPLRLRETPTAGPAGKIITLLDSGTTVAIKAGPLTDSTGVVWYQVTAKGVTGWAMAQYLAQAATEQTQVEATAAPRAQNASARSGSSSSPPTAVSAVATRVVPTATPRPARTPTPAPTQAASAPISTSAQYRQWIEEARKAYPYTQSVDKMWSVMMCESSGNPRASGGGGAFLGLFQYSPATWAGRWNPYRNESIWDARSQIFATAKAWSIGMQSAWSCYYITPGR